MNKLCLFITGAAVAAVALDMIHQRNTTAMLEYDFDWREDERQECYNKMDNRFSDRLNKKTRKRLKKRPGVGAN